MLVNSLSTTRNYYHIFLSARRLSILRLVQQEYIAMVDARVVKNDVINIINVDDNGDVDNGQ